MNQKNVKKSIFMIQTHKLNMHSEAPQIPFKQSVIQHFAHTLEPTQFSLLIL